MNRSVCSALLVGGWLLYASVAFSASVGLAFVEAVRKGADGLANLLDPEALAVSPDGANLYVATDPGGVAFRIDVATGVLSFLQAFHTGDGAPVGGSGVALSPDGRHVYVTGDFNNSVAVYRRDLASGLLTFVELKQDGVDGVDGLARAFAVAVSPDGGSVYVAGLNDDALAVFQRDAGTGALTFVEVQRDGVGGVDGLKGAIGVAVSPDAKHVYAIGLNDDAVAYFARDLTTGALTFIGLQRDGVGGVNDLAGPTGVAASPDGKNIYVAASSDSALTVFTRDGSSGQLTLLETHTGDETSGARHVALNADGSELYLTGFGMLRMFSRNTSTGALSLLDQQFDSARGVTGLDGGGASAITPDGRHVYGNGSATNQVSLFQTVAVKCAAAPLAMCRQSLVPGKSFLLVKDVTPDTNDFLVWKWLKGSATSLGDFGAPPSTTDYALCVYDAAARPQPRLILAAPADGSCKGKPCWKAPGTGFGYADALRTRDGLQAVKLRAGAAGSASIKAVARGGNIFRNPTLPLTPPVVVQAQTSSGTCWEARYSTPFVNDASEFRAKAD